MVTDSAGRVAALRGATTVPENSAEDIVEATLELLHELLDRNEIRPQDIISMIFTSTQDLTAEFPAVAARKLGLTEVPLLCSAEIAVPGALARCVRVLVHFHWAAGPRPGTPVYLRGARELRADLTDPT